MVKTAIGRPPLVKKKKSPNSSQKRKQSASTSGGSPVAAPTRVTAPAPLRRSGRNRTSEVAQERSGGSEPPVADPTRVTAPSPSRRSGSNRTSEAANSRTEEQNETQEQNEEGLEPIPPIDMYFSPIHYASVFKLYCACDDVKTVPLLELILGTGEIKYFDEHPSFKHVMHMPRLPHHRLQHLWFSLLRTVKNTEGKVVWFLVNGVPIRYSIKEHGLLCGMSCKKYPKKWKEMGSTNYAEIVFGRYSEEKETKIKVPEVVEMLKNMPPGDFRVKTALLLFLSTVIVKSKTAGHIDPWLIRAVDDLEGCKKFPWGRYTFDHQLKWIRRAADHFKGRMLKSYTFPGFFYPVSMLVCEAIPALREQFRIENPNAYDHSCPRMCKTTWAPTDMKGWPIVTINHVLGDTKEIDSTLTPTDDEKTLLEDIMADDDIDAGACELTVNWNACIEANKKIFFEDRFQLDVNGRAENLGAPKALSLKEELKKMFDEGLGEVKTMIGEVLEKVNSLDGRLRETETGLRKLKAWRDAIDPFPETHLPPESDFAGGEAGVETETGGAGVETETGAGAGVETEGEAAQAGEEEEEGAEEDGDEEEEEGAEEDGDEEEEEGAEEDESVEEEEDEVEEEGEDDADEDDGEEDDDDEDVEFQQILKRSKKD